jgi:hypothetical protein
MKHLSNERFFDKGAWWLLAGVGLFVCLVLVNTVAVLRLPGDGWQMDYNERDQGDHLLAYFLGDWPTPLQVGDVVTAVNSQALPDSVRMTPLAPPKDWVNGGTVQYTVQRQGEILDVPVTLHRLSPAGILRGLANTMRDELLQWSWFVVAMVVFFLRPNNRAARLLLIAGASFVIVDKVGWAATTIRLDFAPPLTWLVNWVAGFFWGWLFFPSLILLLLTFPLTLWPLTRFPRLVPALFYGIPLAITAYTLLTGLPDLATALLFAEAVLIFGTAVAAIVQVFRHRQNRVARAQVSWVTLGIAISIGGTLIAYLLEYTGAVKVIGTPLEAILSWPITLALPVCLATAILRYHLFDIDVIIRKTLVYTLLSALLALVYFGSVVLLQTIFDSVAQEQSPFIIVVSTLLIAALFAPLRQRVQLFIDRRFYRRKYDAQQVLAQFAQTAREEVSLEVLTTELTRVVQETVQPEEISVWVKPITRKR